jgi:uncharacterized protein (DUF1697 family)
MPPLYAAFLRGINLGRRRVTGDQLREPFLRLGFSHVSTFLASGNVAFDPGPGVDARELTARIEERLEADLGYPVAVFLRSASRLAAIVATAPFGAAELERSTGKLQVILLRQAPPHDLAARVLADAPAADRLAFRGTELFWLPQGNMSDSDLDITTLDRLIGPTTVRTHNTLARLYARFFEDGAQG